MKRMWIVGVLALAVVVIVATPAGAAAGGNGGNAKLCQKDGWKTLYRDDGSTFANQHECISYGAHGNTILTTPPVWRAACEQAGGTFTVSDKDALGRPIAPPAFAYLCNPVSSGTWRDVLNPICQAYADGFPRSWISTNGGTGDCVRSGTA